MITTHESTSYECLATRIIKREQPLTNASNLAESDYSKCTELWFEFCLSLSLSSASLSYNVVNNVIVSVRQMDSKQVHVALCFQQHSYSFALDDEIIETKSPIIIPVNVGQKKMRDRERERDGDKNASTVCSFILKIVASLRCFNAPSHKYLFFFPFALSRWNSRGLSVPNYVMT